MSMWQMPITTPSAKSHLLELSAPSPVLLGVFGSADGTGSAARFYFPNGVAVDSAGNVYVADTTNATIRKITPAGVVSTLAGLAGVNGSANGTGSAARFFNPYGVAVDSAGNVYVADTSNQTIRKITPAGVVSTLAGSPGVVGSADGTGSAARFNYPNSLAVDSAGNVYVADTQNSTIRKITPAGVVSTFAGSPGVTGSADGTGSAALFHFPYGVTVDSAGNIFVADSTNSTIRKITPARVVSTLAGSPGIEGSADGTGSAAQFNNPYGVAVTSAGNVFVADTYNLTIRKVTSAGVVSTVAGSVGFSGSDDGAGIAAKFFYPYGVVVNSAGTVYVADTNNSTIRKITTAGVVSTFAGSPGVIGSANGTGSAAQFNNPSGVAVDSAGNVFVADTNNQTIRKITSAGVVTTFAGSPGAVGSADGTGGAARFNSPNGVAADSAGNVFVADTSNQTIRKITPAGVVSTFAGSPGVVGSANGTGAAARFSSPYGVAVDSAGNVYVADSGNATIRKITPAAVVSTLAGSPGATGSADGTGSAARFDFSTGVAVDSAGNVYVMDSNNFLIRKITAGGVVTTVAGLPGFGGSANGTGSDARFSFAYGVAVDGAGNVYVADTINSAIRIGGGFSAVSRKTHGGGTGNFDISLPLTGTAGVECRTSGASNAYQIIVTAPGIAPSSVAVTSGVGVVDSASTSADGKQLTINLSGVSNAQAVIVTLLGRDDSRTTDDVAVKMRVLVGDTTGNGTVNSSDISETKASSGEATNTANFRRDVNVSGAISSSDISLVKSKSGTSVPP